MWEVSNSSSMTEQVDLAKWVAFSLALLEQPSAWPITPTENRPTQLSTEAVVALAKACTYHKANVMKMIAIVSTTAR
jgi:hypothetical protein